MVLTKVMTGELDDMFNAELNNLVPGIWTKDGIGYPCLKPLNSWFEDQTSDVMFQRTFQRVPSSHLERNHDNFFTFIKFLKV